MEDMDGCESTQMKKTRREGPFRLSFMYCFLAFHSAEKGPPGPLSNNTPQQPSLALLRRAQQGHGSQGKGTPPTPDPRPPLRHPHTPPHPTTHPAPPNQEKRGWAREGRLLEVGRGAVGLVDAAERLGGRALDPVGQGELDLGVL